MHTIERVKIAYKVSLTNIINKSIAVTAAGLKIGKNEQEKH